MKWILEGWHWYSDGWKNYATFDGRSRRKAYWYFIIFHNAILISTILLAYFTFKPFLIFAAFYFCASILPHLAVTVRRLHDTDHDWAWLYVPFLFRFDVLCADSQPQENKYGPDPKEKERIFLDYPPETFDHDINRMTR